MNPAAPLSAELRAAFRTNTSCRHTHPLARAVVAHARTLGLTLQTPTTFNNEPGLGIEAVLPGDDRRILAGGRALLAGHAIALPPNLDASLMKQGVGTPTSTGSEASRPACSASGRGRAAPTSRSRRDTRPSSPAAWPTPPASASTKVTA